MASFVPVSDLFGAEFSANLDRCNYMEAIKPDGGSDKARTILHFPGPDSLTVSQSKEDIALMNAKLNKGK